MSNYFLLIQQVIQACVEKNASMFASLFNEDAQIQLDNQNQILKADMERITTDYFSNLKFIEINVIGIAINEEDNIAFVEWIWSDYNLNKNKNSSHQNAIALEFKDNLIYRWREYNIISS